MLLRLAEKFAFFSSNMIDLNRSKGIISCGGGCETIKSASNRNDSQLSVLEPLLKLFVTSKDSFVAQIKKTKDKSP